MPNLPFTLRQLEVFEVLSELRSFRNSAEKLGISQASISNQVKELEVQLGVQLVARSPGKRPALTPEGLLFLDDLHAFRAAAEKLASHRRAAPVSGEVTRFRVLIGQGMMDRYVRPKLDNFLYQNPDIECDFVTQLPYGPGALKKLDEDHFDCALLHVLESTANDERLRRLVRVENGVFGHRKFAGGEAGFLAPAAISKLPFILPPVGSPQERATMGAFAEVGIRPSTVVTRTQYYDVMASMVERGLGVAVLSKVVMRAESSRDVVLLYRLPGWLLVWYRSPKQNNLRMDALERFLTSAVLDDPAYPAVSLQAQRD